MLVVVPNLVGMTREQAEADLTDRGLNPVAKNRETDPADADPGTVVDQDPKDGVEVAKGADVDDLHRRGAQHHDRRRTWRDRRLSAAQTELSAAGLRLGSQLQEPSATILQGRSRSEPAAGSEVEQGSVVDVYVSTGPEQVTVPDVSDRMPVDGVGAQGPEGCRLGNRGG